MNSGTFFRKIWHITETYSGISDKNVQYRHTIQILNKKVIVMSKKLLLTLSIIYFSFFLIGNIIKSMHLEHKYFTIKNKSHKFLFTNHYTNYNFKKIEEQ